MAESLNSRKGTSWRCAARGDGLTNVVAAHEIGASLSALHPVEAKKPDEHAEHKPGKHDEHRRRTGGDAADRPPGRTHRRQLWGKPLVSRWVRHPAHPVGQ
jgi:hypothetical protein